MAGGLALSQARTAQSPCNRSIRQFGGLLALLLLVELVPVPASCEPRLYTLRPRGAKRTNDKGQLVLPCELQVQVFFTSFF